MFKNFYQKWKNRFWRSIFLSYLVLMVVIVSIAYVGLISQMMSGKHSEQEAELRHKDRFLAQVIDEKFSNVELTAAQIAASSWINYAGSKSDILYSKMDVLKKQEISDSVGNSSDLLRIAKSMAVIFVEKKLAVDKVAFWECADYFRSIDLNEELLDELLEKMDGQYMTQVLYTTPSIYERNHDFIIVKQLEYDVKPEKLLFVYVDGKQFQKFLESTAYDIAELKILYNDEPLYTYVNKKSEGRGGQNERLLSSDLYNWTYSFTWDAPKDDTSAFPFQILGFFGLLIPEIGIAYILTIFCYRPILSLAEKMGLKKKNIPYGLDAIGSAYLKLSDEKEKMEWEANKYYMIAQEGFLLSLLQGGNEETQMEDYVKKFNLHFQSDMDYLVLILNYMGNPQEKSYQKAILDLQIQCLRLGTPVAACMTEQRYVFILSADEKQTAVTRQAELIGTFLDEFFGDMEIELFSGKAYSGFHGICRSYNEAKEKMVMENTLGQIAYYYPLEMEMKMINFMRIGNFQSAGEILNEIRLENQRRKLSFYDVKRVTQLLFEVFSRYAEDIQVDSGRMQKGFVSAVESRDEENIWNYLSEMLFGIAKLYDADKHIKLLGREIVAYVDAHYSCSELSQQDVADAFRVSRPTVSKLFKATAKMNFIDYLHKRRVEQAKLLFEQGNLDVLDVGAKVGYENEVTFKRAFQKHESMTPREYVRMLKSQK